MAQETRRRQRLGTRTETCWQCGHEGLELIESHRVRRFGPRAGVRRYLRCPACGARSEAAQELSPLARTTGWVVVGVLGLIVLVETVVLAGMTSLLSVPLAVVPVLVVAVALVFIIRSARRAPRA